MIQRLNQHERLWHTWERVPHPILESLLIARDQLIVLTHGQPPFKVVLGVPHQAAVGVHRICDRRLDEHGNIKDRKADDNVASFALVAFSQLKMRNVPCKLVVMTHPTTHDPNKVADSPYCREVLSQKSHLLLECHAMGARRHFDLEVSAGSNRLGRPVEFGRTLSQALEHRFSLGMQTVARRSNALIIQPGGETVKGKLQLPATKTISLIEAGELGIPALHLEAKPNFRVPRDLSNSVSPDGQLLGQAIAKTIMALG